MASRDLIAQLQSILGSEHVLTDPDLRATYETDWTRRFTGNCLAVVRPGDAEQVSAVLRTCRDAGVSIVPQGGNTGLVGGGVPRGGEVVLSTARLQTVSDFDGTSGEVTAGAGVTLALLQEAIAGSG